MSANVGNGLIPLAQPDLSGNELGYLIECLNSGWISSRGPWVERFETMLSARFGHPAASCANGTGALWLALKALGIGRGDDVVVPDLTFAATANAVLATGANLVLADIDPLSKCLSVETVERVITKRTRAIIAVHLYGNAAPVGELKKFLVPIIEDSAEAIDVPPTGDFACFSFFGNKVMTTGEGGAVVGADLDAVKIYRDHGHVGGYIHDVAGLNWRMTALQAAVGCAQLERLTGMLERRREIARRYHAAFYWLGGGGTWLYTFTSPIKDRVEFVERLAERGIEARIGFEPLHRQKPYLSDRAFPVADYHAGRDESKSGGLVSIPTGTHLSDADVECVIAAVLASCPTMNREVA